MIIKKFQGKTEAEATENAKKELGNGVVVMNVKELKRKGVFAFLKPKMIEVTVALEEEPDRTTVARREAAKTVTKEAVVQKTQEDKNDKVLEEKLESLQTLLEKQLQRGDSEKEADEDNR